MRVASVATLFLPLVLTGCSVQSVAPPAPSAGLSLQGRIHGGQQPVVGAHIYLLAANTTGYGNPSVSLLNSTTTGLSDSVGAYVTTGSDGGFTITGDYTCTPGTQVYVYALGGNPGGGINSAAGFLAALGQCPTEGNFLAATPYIWINEVSTIAAAYAMSGFATDATHVSSSGTVLARIGIGNAFANAANLAALSTGTALATTPAGNGTVPQTTINTLANILASCVNSTGPASTTCSTLFSNASNGSTLPTDTASAAINIAHNPGSNITALFDLQAAEAPFQPDIFSNPNDFTIALDFFGGGLSDAISIAIDSLGNAWLANYQGSSSVIELSSTGAILSGPAGYTGNALIGPYSIAIDNSGNVWTANYDNNTVTELSNTGMAISPSGGYTINGLGPDSIAIDGSGNAWIGNYGSRSLTKLSGTGLILPGPSGYTGILPNFPSAIAIDSSGNAWIADWAQNRVTEISSIGADLSGSAGYTGGGLSGAASVAIDSSGNAWIANYNTGVTKLSSNGAPLSPSTSFTGGGLDGSTAIAIDGSGNAWVTNTGNASVTELSNTGASISPSTGYTGGVEFSPFSIAIDGSGNVWTVNSGRGSGQVREFIGAATPVVTPLATGVMNNALGARP
jgi:hypothetical protein